MKDEIKFAVERVGMVVLWTALERRIAALRQQTSTTARMQLAIALSTRSTLLEQMDETTCTLCGLSGQDNDDAPTDHPLFDSPTSGKD